MKLRDVINDNKKTIKDKINIEKEKYKELCQQHWKKNKTEILNYLGDHSRKSSKKLFISYAYLETTPFKNIPIFEVISKNAAANDERAYITDTFAYYLECLGIKHTRIGSTYFPTYDKDHEKNGIEINLDSKFTPPV